MAGAEIKEPFVQYNKHHFQHYPHDGASAISRNEKNGRLTAMFQLSRLLHSIIIGRT